MRKNYFAKLVNYMKNVYHVDHGLNKLSDGRVNPTFSTGQVILPVLFGFLLRIKSFNELNFMIKSHEFSKLVPRRTKLAQVDAIRDTLKVINIDGLKQVNYHIVKTAINNKVFVNGTIDGYTVVAIDGTKFFGSNKKSCSECLKNMNGNKTHCFHSGAVMSTVGMGPKLVIGFEMYKPGQDSTSKDEGELSVGKRLITRQKCVQELQKYLLDKENEICKFDETLFRKVVEKVKVRSMVEVEFVFNAGIEAREIL